ncbi:MAG: tetratricopeptide repeat protein, partial [Acidobacteriota bacterium]
YRLKKLVRRHRTAVGAATLGLLILLGTLAGTSIGLTRAIEAEKKALAESALAEGTAEFLVSLFDGSDPTSYDPSPTARALLDRGARLIDEDLKDQPRRRVRMLESIGRAYRGLGELDEAAALLQEALDFRRLDDATDDALATTLFHLADVRSAQGDAEAATALATEALELRRAAANGPSLDVAESQQQLGLIAERSGDFDRSRDLYSDALAAREQLLGPGDPSLGGVLNNLGNDAARRGDPGGAEALFTRALTLYTDGLGAEHPNVASTLNNLALLKGNNGELEAAEELHGRALAIRRSALDADHPDLAETYNNYGVVLTDLGRYDDAVAMNLEALKIRREVYGVDHFSYASTVFNQGRIEDLRKRFEAARAYYEEALDIFERTLGPDHMYTSYPLASLAAHDRGTGRYALALERYRRTLEIRTPVLDSDAHPLIQEPLRNLHGLLLEMGRTDEAARVAERIIEVPADGSAEPG